MAFSHKRVLMKWIVSLGDAWQRTIRRRTALRCQGWCGIALFALVATIFPFSLFAQTQPFSPSSEYQSMLKELHHNPVRPSRMSAGTLLATARQPAQLKVEETAVALHLETDAWRLLVTKNPCRIALTNLQTGLAWQLAGSGGEQSGIVWTQGTPVAAILRLAKIQHIERRGDRWRLQVEVAGSNEPATLEIDVISPTVIRLSIRAPHLVGDTLGMNFRGAGPLFGSGERFDRVRLDGLETVLRPEDLFGKPGHNWTYIPIPFLFTPHGLGVYLDTAAVSTFDLSNAGHGLFSMKLENPSVDAYFFIGEPKGILEDYTALTGRTPLSPPWAFGVWICSYQGPQTVLEDARRLRKDGIPASAIWTFDVMGKGGIMGWPLWWTGYYPHPRQFTDQLHAMGFKVLTYVHPYLRSVLDPYNLPNPSFEKGEQTDRFIQPLWPGFESYPDGNIDFTSAANVNWWEQQIGKIVRDDNFDGWMEDFGEWVNDNDRFAAGVTGRKMENLNPLFYHKITYEVAHKLKPDIVEFDRSGYAGSQGYTRVIWGGDQFPNWTEDHGLPSVVKGGITAGLSGFAVWGPDIEGNGFSTELWTRWVEFGALTPIMRNHLWDKPYGAVDLWSNAQTIDTFRRYARLHISLFPYFYTYAHEATKTGLPIIRGLMLDYPYDPKTYGLSAEYMLGDKIIVAPVVKQGATSRTAYLPQGSWTDYWTGKVMQGGRQVTVSAPLQQIPIFVHSGSILPYISADTETLAQDLAGNTYRTLSNHLTWRVFSATAPAQDSFKLYDGTVAQASQQPSRMQVRVTHSPIVRHYEIILPAIHTPQAVILDGKPLDEIKSISGRMGKTGWQLIPDSRTLHVFFRASDFDLSVGKETCQKAARTN